MLENLTDAKERNGHHPPVKVVFIGGDEPTLSKVIQSIHLRWPLALMMSASTGAEGLEVVRQASPDLVIMHTDLSDMFPQVLVEELRDISSVPILVLAPEIDETEATSALELGADDYILFPCGLWQFAARVWAVLRRSGFVPFQDEKQRFLISGRLLIDPQGYEVYLDDQKVHLTPIEFRLLYLLAKNHGRVVPHRVLENELWGNRESMPQSAKKHIQRLRGKLEDNPADPQWIASVYGVGYRFVGPRPRWQGSFHSN